MSATHHAAPDSRYSNSLPPPHDNRRLPSLKDLNFPYRRLPPLSQENSGDASVHAPSPAHSTENHSQSQTHPARYAEERRRAPSQSLMSPTGVIHHHYSHTHAEPQQQHTPPLSAGHDHRAAEYQSKHDANGYLTPGVPLSAQMNHGAANGSSNIRSGEDISHMHPPKRARTRSASSSSVDVSRETRPPPQPSYPPTHYPHYMHPQQGHPPPSPYHSLPPAPLPPPPPNSHMAHHGPAQPHPGYSYQPPYMGPPRPVPVHDSHPQAHHMNYAAAVHPSPTTPQQHWENHAPSHHPHTSAPIPPPVVAHPPQPHYSSSSLHQAAPHAVSPHYHQHPPPHPSAGHQPVHPPTPHHPPNPPANYHTAQSPQRQSYPQTGPFPTETKPTISHPYGNAPHPTAPPSAHPVTHHPPGPPHNPSLHHVTTHNAHPPPPLQSHDGHTVAPHQTHYTHVAPHHVSAPPPPPPQSHRSHHQSPSISSASSTHLAPSGPTPTSAHPSATSSLHLHHYNQAPPPHHGQPHQPTAQTAPPSQQHGTLMRTTPLIPTEIESRNSYPTPSSASNRDALIAEIVRQCSILHHFAGRFATIQRSVPLIQPSPAELNDMIHRANRVVQMLEDLGRQSPPHDDQANVPSPTTSRGDQRQPKRPWEEDMSRGANAPEAEPQPQPVYPDAYRSPVVPKVEPPPPPPPSGPSAAEQDMEIIRTKRASSAAAAASSSGQAKNKYRKRSRATPPGKCHSCNIRETPEWRRGPDGARTLCNACGLHYAKLMRKQERHNGTEGPVIDLETLRASARQAELDKATRSSNSKSQSHRRKTESDSQPPPADIPQSQQHHQGSFQVITPATINAQAQAPPPPPLPQASSSSAPPPPWSTGPGRPYPPPQASSR